MAKVIRLPLSAAGQSFLAKLSGDDYESLVFEAFLPLDLIYTFGFRYARVISHDIPGNTPTNGAPIDFTSTHNPAIAAVVTLAMLGLAAANLYREYQKQRRKQQNASYRFIHGELEKKGQFELDAGEVRAFEQRVLMRDPYQVGLLAAAPSSEEQVSDRVPLLQPERHEEALRNAEQKVAHDEEKKRRKNQFINECLLQELRDDQEGLFSKYEKIEIDGDQLKFTLRDPTPEQIQAKAQKDAEEVAKQPGMLRRVVGSVWEMLGISAFAYWLIWIGGAVFTGQFAVGVAGLNPGAAFGVPFALGSIYGLIQSYRWVKETVARSRAAARPGEQAASLEEYANAEKDACELMRRAIIRRKFTLAKDKLVGQLGGEQEKAAALAKYVPASEGPQLIASSSLDGQMRYLQQDHKIKTGMAFVSNTLGAFGLSQYVAWIVTDFLSVVAHVASMIPIVNMVCGSIMIGGSLLYGIYKAVERYNKVDEDKTTLSKMQLVDAEHQVATLEDDLRKKEARIQALKGEMAERKITTPDLPSFVKFDQPQFFRDVNREGEDKWTKFKKFAVRALTFVNYFTTGAFIARIFFVKGSAVFLPFAAAALSNPITIGIVVGIGLLFGAYKVYEYHQSRKEAAAREILAQRTVRIDCLKKQVELADLSICVLEKRKEQALPSSGVVAAGMVRGADGAVPVRTRVSLAQASFLANDSPTPPPCPPSPVVGAGAARDFELEPLLPSTGTSVGI